MFSTKKLKSDFVSLFNNKTQNEPLPNGYPCSFDSDCQSPGVCQFNVCTVNIGGNETSDLANICHGLSITDCAKEMQKEREGTSVPIFVPNIPMKTITITGGTGGTGVSYVQVPDVRNCKFDADCSRNEFCMNKMCIDKSNFPLIARQKRLKSMQNTVPNFDPNTFFEHKKTPLDGTLKPYEYMFLLEPSLEQKKETTENVKLYDDYFYVSQK